jgi:uncharacterized lipoprotein YmbA
MRPSAFCLLLAGCSFLKATKDPTQYFVLTSDERRPPAVPSPLVLGIDHVQLPEYLLRDEMVSRSANNQLTLAEYQQWGEPLKDGFSRTLRHNLENQLGVGHVVAAPFDPASRPPLVVDVEVRRFERIAGQGAVLEASWALRDGKSGLTLATRDARVQRPTSEDPRATVAALSTTVAALAQEVAGAARATLTTSRPRVIR